MMGGNKYKKALYALAISCLANGVTSQTQQSSWNDWQEDIQTPIHNMRPQGDGKGGNTRHITLDITDQLEALDGGKERLVYAINGRPFNGGEPIFLEEGEEVEIELNNFSDQLNTSTTLHAHGIEQIGSQFNDGVPGVSQNVIKPGESFIYRWRAEEHYGLYWLHSHFAGVYQDGQAVPLYIRPKEDRKNPFDIIAGDEEEVEALKRHDQDPEIIMISDYMEINNWEMKEKMEEWQSELLCINTPLLNGRGRVNCATSENLQKWTESNTTTDKGCVDRSLRPGSENITFDEELWYTCTPTDVEVPTYEFDYETGWGIIHFVNAASHWQYMISIDEHELNFFAADGSYVKPVKGDAFTIGIGERIGVAFHLHTPGEYVLRVSAHDEPQVVGQFGIIRYGLDDDDDSVEYSDPDSEDDPGMPSIPLSEPFINYAGQPVSDDVRVMNNSVTALKQFAPPELPKRGEAADITLHFTLSNSNFIKWSFSEEGKVEYYNSTNEYQEPPILYDMESYMDDSSISTFPSGSVVDIIITNEERYNITGVSHPLHKHFEHYHVLAAGVGNFTYQDVIEAEDAGIDINWLDPSYRDTVMIPASPAESASYLVLRYVSVQPTASLIHCHIQSHSMSGMAYVLIASDEGGTPDLPDYYSIKAFNTGLTDAANAVKQGVN